MRYVCYRTDSAQYGRDDYDNRIFNTAGVGEPESSRIACRIVLNITANAYRLFVHVVRITQYRRDQWRHLPPVDFRDNRPTPGIRHCERSTEILNILINRPTVTTSPSNLSLTHAEPCLCQLAKPIPHIAPPEISHRYCPSLLLSVGHQLLETFLPHE